MSGDSSGRAQHTAVWRPTLMPIWLRPLSVPPRSLHHNPLIRAGWDVLPALQRLTALDIRYCGLADLGSVPPELSALSALAVLDIGNNPVEEGWQHLAGCSALTALRMNSCGELPRLPREWSRLVVLRRLELRYTMVMGGGTEALRRLCPQLEDVVER